MRRFRDGLCERGTARRKRVSAGNSLVEFALVAPVLLLTVTGMFALAFGLQNKLQLINGVNLGAQTLAISRGQTTDPCNTAYSAIVTGAPTLTASSLTLTFVINGVTFNGTSCTSGAADMVQGQAASVTATYPCTGAYYGVDLSPCVLTAKTTELIQ